MRTIECNICGEPLTGHDDEALAQRLLEHVNESHPDEEFGSEDASDQVAEEAYSASDN